MVNKTPQTHAISSNPPYRTAIKQYFDWQNTSIKVSLAARGILAINGIIFSSPLLCASGLLIGSFSLAMRYFSQVPQRSFQNDLDEMQKNGYICSQKKTDNKKIFIETCAAFSRGHYQTATGRTVRLNAALQIKMERDSRVYSSIRPSDFKPNPRYQTQITVENLSTLRMTEKLLNQGLNPLVLDMANRYTAGGGVRYGANAQEEILCRQSNLMRALAKLESQNKYPIPELGGIYVPGVQFFRADPSEGYAFLESPLTASVFASAAYDCGSDRPADDIIYQRNTKEKIRTVLLAALKHGHDSVVLSAFGCGAFHNDPRLIATLYKEVFAEPKFKGRFKKISFGIIEDHNSRRNNFNTFKTILCRS